LHLLGRTRINMRCGCILSALKSACWCHVRIIAASTQLTEKWGEDFAWALDQIVRRERNIRRICLVGCASLFMLILFSLIVRVLRFLLAISIARVRTRPCLSLIVFALFFLFVLALIILIDALEEGIVWRWLLFTLLFMMAIIGCYRFDFLLLFFLFLMLRLSIIISFLSKELSLHTIRLFFLLDLGSCRYRRCCCCYLL